MAQQILHSIDCKITLGFIRSKDRLLVVSEDDQRGHDDWLPAFSGGESRGRLR